MLAKFVLFVVAVFDNLLLMALVGVISAIFVFLTVRIYQRKQFLIHIMDDFGDMIAPMVHKGATVLMFAGVCMWGGNKITDGLLDTYIELSCLSGVTGIALGILLWRMWQN